MILLLLFLDKFVEVSGVQKVMIHFEQTSLLTAEIVIKVDESMSVKDSKELAKKLQDNIMKEIDIKNVEIHLDLSNDESIAKNSLPPIIISPPYSQRGQQEIKFA